MEINPIRDRAPFEADAMRKHWGSTPLISSTRLEVVVHGSSWQFMQVLRWSEISLPTKSRGVRFPLPAPCPYRLMVQDVWFSAS